MRKHEVRNLGHALAYITDCNLATVASMALKKSRGKHEYERQISIAQTAIDWMVAMEVDFSGTRSEDVFLAGGVEKWATKLSSPQPAVTQPESNCPKSLTDPYDTIEQQDFIQKGK